MRLRTDRTLGDSDRRASGQPLAMRWTGPDTLSVAVRRPEGLALDDWAAAEAEGGREIAPILLRRREADTPPITAAVDDGEEQLVTLEERDNGLSLALWEREPLRCVGRIALDLAPRARHRLAVCRAIALASDGVRAVRIDLRRLECAALPLDLPETASRFEPIAAIAARPDGFSLASGASIGLLPAEGGPPVWVHVGRELHALVATDDTSVAGVGSDGAARVSSRDHIVEGARARRTWPWVAHVDGRGDLLVAVVGSRALAIDLGEGWVAPIDGRSTACRVALDGAGQRLAIAYDIRAPLIPSRYALRAMAAPSIRGATRERSADQALSEREALTAEGLLDPALGHAGSLRQLAYGPSAELYSMGADGGPIVWEENGAARYICPAPHQQDQNTVAVAATGELWYGDIEGLWVRQAERWSERPAPDSSRGYRDVLFYVERVCVSADGTSALVCSAVESRGYMRVELWRRGDDGEWACERHLGVALRADQIALSPDGRFAVTRTDEGSMVIDLRSFSTPTRPERFAEEGGEEDEEDDNEEDDETIDAARCLRLGETFSLEGAAISPDSRWAVLGTQGQTLALVDLASMEVRTERSGTSVEAAAFLSRGLLATIEQRPPRLRLRRLPDLSPAADVTLDAAPCAVAADPARGAVAVGLSDGRIIEFRADEQATTLA